MSESAETKKPVSQPHGISRRMTASIVVEICVHRHSLSVPAGAPLGPRIENVVGIAPRIPLRTVKAKVEKRSNRPAAGGGPCHVVKTHRHVMPCQQRERVVAIPARIAKLDGMEDALRQRSQERFETFEIARPSWRQLVEHGAELPSKLSRA